MSPITAAESANVIRAILLVAALGSIPATAAELDPCFTPGENCTRKIVDEIDSAKESLLVQAYEFTSYPIINAIVRANDRGVDVSIILDQDNDKAKRSGQESIAAHLIAHGLFVLIDNRHIAHNKVMVIDGKDVITGSFNFTIAAQDRNAENVLIIRDNPAIAKAYGDNFWRRADDSHPPARTED